MSKWRLLYGDALYFMSQLPQDSVDMVLCDLPYGMTANKWDEQLDSTLMWWQLQRIVRKDRAMCFFASMPFTAHLVQTNPENWKTEWIWRKNQASNFLTANVRPLKIHESIQVFAYGTMPYYPEKSTGHPPTNAAVRKSERSSNYNSSREQFYAGGATDRYPRSVLEYSTVPNISPNRIHPTQKPVELLRYLIRTHSKPGDIVLDFCAGSGSTGIACLLENRHFIGIEKDPEYYQKARAWIKKIDGGPLFSA